MPVYHSGNLRNTDRPHYNYPLRPQTPDRTRPLAPRNLIITNPYSTEKTDIRWDNPKIIPQNSGLNILGCNVYRSTDGPDNYVKVNDTPVTVLFYRDETKEQYVASENATPTIKHTLEPEDKWFVYAQNRPMIIPDTNGEPTTRIGDVKVEIDNGDGVFLEWPAFSVNGITGEIELIRAPVYNYQLQQIVPARLPYPPNGRVRISYTYLQHQVLTVLSQRIYYKVTAVAEDPDDNTATIETPLDEISDRTAFDVEAIDWIWREGIRRNRWILEQGGERVKIFIRKWMGETCPSHETNYGQGYNDCLECFPAGTEITMDDFTRKPIENVQIGDKVLTHTGEIKNVYNIMSRDIDENIIDIKSIHSINITPTKNHPLLVLKKENAKCFRDKHLNCTGADRTICNREPWKDKCKRDTTKDIQWLKASDVRQGDYLVFPIPKGDSKSFTESELKFLGYYAAEGNTSKRDKKTGGMTEQDKRVIFSFNKNEIDTCIKELEGCTNQLGHKQCITKAGENSVSVTVSSIKLVDLVLTHVGKYSKKKQLSKRLVWQKKPFSLKFLGTYFNGDGSQTINSYCTSISSSSASNQLSRQIQTMLFRCNIISNFISRTRTVTNPLREGFHKTISHEVKISKNYMNALAQNSLYKELKFRRSGQCFINNGFVFYPIKEISKQKFVGKVYNIEVEDDHSYVANGVAVHNCYGTNIVGGYDGPYSVMIAPPESEKMIELADMGLHIRYDWATWMGPWPLLNERDVIVRQNNERYVVGPVTPQGSRGAIYQQHFSMSYVDQGDIRYKIPITGGETSVPASYDPYREEAPTEASPAVNDKPEIPEEKIIRGRTVIFENITYALLTLLLPYGILMKYIIGG